MRYITKYSKRALVNRLAERISQKLSDGNKHDTVIEVTDCGSFLVVQGLTNNTTVLNLQEYKQEFMSLESEFLENVGVKKLNFIDIIDYKSGVDFHKLPYCFEFWNSKRPLYHPEVVDLVENSSDFASEFESINYTNKVELETLFPNHLYVDNTFGGPSNLSITSQFPYGYSLKAGKTKLYYSEYICNQLFSVLNTDRILFRMWDEISENGDYNIQVITNSQYKDEEVKSMVLDIFDFNFTKFENDHLMNYDFVNELTNPLETKSWINRDRVKELMFV